MRYKVERRAHITRAYVRNNPKKLFLFGDNLIRRGLGGQAREMRGEPNAIGIPTKKLPARTQDAYFTDDEFDANKGAIDRALDDVNRWMSNHGAGAVLVIPASGLGTGRAELAQRAPRTFAYLQMKLNELLRTS